MKKIAVFGKPGSGKSTLSKQIAAQTGIPLYQLDSLQYDKAGNSVAREVFDKAHNEIIRSECWIIDGLGPLASFQQRIEVADTLVYIDLPYAVSYWLVTKRLIKGLFVKPEGWPEGCSILKGTIQSYQTLRLCPKFWNDDFLTTLNALSRAGKSLHIIRSTSELKKFVEHGAPISKSS